MHFGLSLVSGDAKAKIIHTSQKVVARGELFRRCAFKLGPRLEIFLLVEIEPPKVIVGSREATVCCVAIPHLCTPSIWSNANAKSERATQIEHRRCRALFSERSKGLNGLLRRNFERAICSHQLRPVGSGMVPERSDVIFHSVIRQHVAYAVMTKHTALLSRNGV
jgi:hypothetical protein